MENRSTNVFWHDSLTSSKEREKIFNQKGCVVWLTGLSGSGKSTVAHALEHELIQRGHMAYVLDGDNVRHGLCSDLGFNEQGRNENIRRISEVAKLFADAGICCITAFISPFKRTREQAEAIIGKGRYLEVHVAADLSVCEERDTKGLYKKARNGELSDFTGISSPYEAPESPALALDTSVLSVEESVKACVSLLKERSMILSRRKEK